MYDYGSENSRVRNNLSVDRENCDTTRTRARSHGALLRVWLAGPIAKNATAGLVFVKK